MPSSARRTSCCGKAGTSGPTASRSTPSQAVDQAINGWTGAVRAPAALDLARCHVLPSEIAPEIVDDPQRPRAVNAAAQSEYARLAGMSQAALTAAAEPYLPIARVLVLLGGTVPALREPLIQRIEAALRSED
jgi:hypothetical protein